MPETNTGTDAYLIARTSLALVEATLERLARAGRLTKQDLGIIRIQGMPAVGIGSKADTDALADHVTTVLQRIEGQATE